MADIDTDNKSGSGGETPSPTTRTNIDDLKQAINLENDDSRLNWALKQANELVTSLYPTNDIGIENLKNLEFWYTLYIYNGLVRGGIKSEKVGDVSITYEQGDNSFFLNQIRIFDLENKILPTILQKNGITPTYFLATRET